MNSRTAFDLAKAGLQRDISEALFEGGRGSTNCIRSGNDYSPRVSIHIEGAIPVDAGDLLLYSAKCSKPRIAVERHPDRTGVGGTVGRSIGRERKVWELLNKGVDGKEPAQITEDLRLEAHQEKKKRDTAKRGRG